MPELPDHLRPDLHLDRLMAQVMEYPEGPISPLPPAGQYVVTVHNGRLYRGLVANPLPGAQNQTPSILTWAPWQPSVDQGVALEVLDHLATAHRLTWNGYQHTCVIYRAIESGEHVGGYAPARALAICMAVQKYHELWGIPKPREERISWDREPM